MNEGLLDQLFDQVYCQLSGRNSSEIVPFTPVRKAAL